VTHARAAARGGPGLDPVGRVGLRSATQFKTVAVVWVLIAVVLGLFAPKVEHALSGAGWEATGAESVQVRNTVDREFAALSSSALTTVVRSVLPDVRFGHA